MQEVNTRYARENLRSLLDAVSEGQEFILTRRDEPVARLLPIEKPVHTLPSLASFRDSIEVRGRALSEDVIAAREDERS